MQSNAQNTQQGSPLELVLNHLLGPVKKGDTVRQHVAKSCRLLAGSQLRKKLEQDVMSAFIEAGLKGSSSATLIASFVKSEDAQGGLNGNTVH